MAVIVRRGVEVGGGGGKTRGVAHKDIQPFVSLNLSLPRSVIETVNKRQCEGILWKVNSFFPVGHQDNTSLEALDSIESQF